MTTLNDRTIKGILIDVTGVLVESTAGGSKPIVGSVQAMKKLRDAGFKVRFVTNETQRTRKGIVDKLREHGFSMPESEIFSPTKAMRELALAKGLRPFLLVHPGCLEDFEGIPTEDPNCVVLGDAVHKFSYDNLNEAFQVLMRSKGEIYALGKSKYYREDGDLKLDVGPFVAALEFATDRKAVVVGKPDVTFFANAIKDMGLEPAQVVMVGDDVVSDVQGAQKCGALGVLVRSGKYCMEDEKHPSVTANNVMNNLYHFVDQLLS